MWSMDPSSYDVIREAWQSVPWNPADAHLPSCLEHSQRSLLKWNRTVFGNIFFKMKRLQQRSYPSFDVEFDSLIQQCVSEDDNVMLTNVPTREEADKKLWLIFFSNAPAQPPSGIFSGVWQLHNSVCFDNGIFMPDILIHKIRSNMSLWEAGFVESPSGGHRNIPKPFLVYALKWNGEYLITVDAGTTATEGYGSFIVCNSDYQFQSGELIHFFVKDPLILEAQTMLSAVLCAKQKQLSQVWLMGDNKVVIEAIQEKTQASWRIAHIISHVHVDCLHLADFKFVFIPRKHNLLAHELCQWAKRCRLQAPLCLSYLPEPLVNLLHREDFASFIHCFNEEE
ncbi:hypothetical protein Ancab_016643 [Ancistrocladus abbreviatus]